LDTLDRRRDRRRYDCSSDSDKQYDHHLYHPYRRSDKGYFLEEFKKAKPPNFDGEVKKSQDVEAWLLGINKLLRLHDYLENMKARWLHSVSKENQTFGGKIEECQRYK